MFLIKLNSFLFRYDSIDNVNTDRCTCCYVTLISFPFIQQPPSDITSPHSHTKPLMSSYRSHVLTPTHLKVNHIQTSSLYPFFACGGLC